MRDRRFRSRSSLRPRRWRQRAAPGDRAALAGCRRAGARGSPGFFRVPAPYVPAPYRDRRQPLRGSRAGDIRIWGSSYSGGHVLVVGAIDRRVKCVAGQVPLISGHNNARRLIRADFWAGLHRMFEDDRRNRYAGKPPGMIPSRCPGPACALRAADAGFLVVVHRDRSDASAVLAQRGDAALGRDVHRI